MASGTHFCARARASTASTAFLASTRRLLSTDYADVLLPSQAGDPEPKSHAAPSSSNKAPDAAGFGIGLYAVLLLGGALAFGAYQYLQANAEKTQ